MKRSRRMPSFAAGACSRTAASCLGLLGATLLGCDGSQSITEYDYAPYEGDAYPVRSTPVEVPAGGMGVVSDSLSDTISLIDLGSGERFASFPVGRNPVDIDGPHHVALDPSGGFAYVALSYPVVGASGPHATHGSSARPGYAQKLALDDFRVLGQVRIDNNPGDIVLSQDRKRLVTSHFDLQLALKQALEDPTDIEAARATLAVIDPASMSESPPPAAERIPVCVAPHAVLLSEPDGATAYVACYGEDVIAVVRLDDPAAEVKRVPVGAGASGFPGEPSYGPYSAVRSPGGELIAIGNTASKDVRFFDVATESMLADKTFSTFGAPFFPGWSLDGKLLYVPTQQPDSVVVIDVEQATQIAARDFAPGECERPHVVELRDAATLLVVCEGDHVGAGSVLTLDAGTLETVSSTEVGVFPDAIGRIQGGGQ